MSRIVTNLKQSRKLVSLGLDAKTADFFYESEDCLGLSAAWFLHIATNAELDRHTPNLVLPAWSLNVLLGLISVYTMQTDTVGMVFITCEKASYITNSYNNPVDAAFEMVCWLLENKLI